MDEAKLVAKLRAAQAQAIREEERAEEMRLPRQASQHRGMAVAYAIVRGWIEGEDE